MQPTGKRRAAFALAVIAFLSLLALVQTLPEIRITRLPFLYPMRHTVALGLLCVSLALWAAVRGRRMPALSWSAFVIAIASAALAAQAFRWMQLMDQNPAHLLVPVASFIHTALPNSLCLIGLGTAVYALSRVSQPVYTAVLSALTGCVVSTFAVCSLLNELIQTIPASPAFEGEIAADATASFALAGVVLWRLARSRLTGADEAFTLRRSVAVVVFGTFLSFLVWRVLLHERSAVVADQTNSTAAAIVRALRSRIDAHSRGSGGRAPNDAMAAEAIASAASNIAGANYQLFFVRDARVIYSFPNPSRRHETSTVAEAPVPELGGTVRLHPGSQFVRRGASWASHLTLAFGFTSSLLLAFSVYLLQVARERLVRLEEEIVERRRMEQELNQQAKLLTASNADLEEFARAVSHDLQEPLRSVIGFAGLLTRRYSGRLDTDADEFLGYIADSAQRMSKMINGLLSYSRTVYARENPERIDLNETLQWATSNLALAIDESQAKIVGDPLPVVRGNSLQLMQVFQNLLGNAIKYHRPNVSPIIRIHSTRHSNEHVIEFSDNGTGIPENLHTHIFGLFKRAHRREYSGAGIGLAVCKRIIESHGGRIWVESTPGEGSKFCLTLPDAGYTAEESVAAARSAGTRTNSHSGR
ncbi:MAG: sensor histidine kinase [Bryobacteraceae bacterium]